MTEPENQVKPLLSVVIVSYNSKPFIGLTLSSLLRKPHSECEVIVVDNNSTDGTVDYISSFFPKIKLIRNQHNPGFGVACNQGMAAAKGEFFLMLNPDTVVPEDVVEKVLDFMKLHPNCGAMGVKMIDGNGRYLPESKRGLPTFSRSAYRMLGLAKWFPDSKRFAGYYLGHLPIDAVNKIEILSGAFMVLSREAIEKCGGFNERFFMYGEDIDLSWRIKEAGFDVYYNPDITIIHFKGESTARDSRYLRVFYEAMEIFYDIHFGSKRNPFFKVLVKLLILGSRLLSTLRLLISKRLAKQKTIFPLKGKFMIFSTTENISSLIPKQILAEDEHQIVNAPTQMENNLSGNMLFDFSSYSADFVIRTIVKNEYDRDVLMLTHDRRNLLYPVSASRRTYVFSLIDFKVES
ncbi:glycosyltransferase family 2 protein [Natronoflexus pectinivorans]|uniref:GT2 family glycosyltransferase n=1 Tax=Natronoflexus pectinivorans TaxID=682526 RepID=A0A4R2GBI7_9BACT|nr:glycosyltransferase family 2 protein [Natronoflexus pectinivorans]TCO05388.1 GT2 family glycosyltransferase [Natronoflexus pectinivorans]